ncbi:MAG: stealth conserved region 3 domain-containing protein [Gammaproteobacteria bacterium]
MTAKRQLRNVARLVLDAPLERVLATWYRCLPPPQPVDEAPPSSTVAPPIDAVYTWVDDGDASWQQRKRAALAALGRGNEGAAAHSTRFHNREELRYSLRSVARYAPFFRLVHIVTDGQRPAWLDLEHPQIRLVTHAEIFADPAVLPTFNSHAIESQLHHIPGLAERYVYFNDDVFLGRPARPEDFFTADGRLIARAGSATVTHTARDPRQDSTLELAARNNLRLLTEQGAARLLHKLEHVPHAQLKSNLDRLEAEFPHVFRATAAHRFRDPDDYAVATSLQQHFAAARGQGILSPAREGSYPARYVNVASPLLRTTLVRILATRAYKSFCINEPVSADLDTARFDRCVTAFLEAYFPQRSAFERD